MRHIDATAGGKSKPGIDLLFGESKVVSVDFNTGESK